MMAIPQVMEQSISEIVVFFNVIEKESAPKSNDLYSIKPWKSYGCAMHWIP